jgi:rhodanese-related sulfurtransferase
MKKTITTIQFIAALSLFFLYSCDNEDDPMIEESYTDVMAGQVKGELVDDASITPYAAVFDVSPVYDRGHLPFATNTGGVEGLGTLLGGLDKNGSYLVYCHSDAPSIAGAELLVENGFTNVHRLEGNYTSWNEVSFVDISAAEVKSKIDAGDFEAIFDVSPHFNDGHLPGATNANAGAGGTNLSQLIEGRDKTKTYLVYCHSDSPAMAGAQLMEDAGFENVYRLEGNYGAWTNAGYDVEQ